MTPPPAAAAATSPPPRARPRRAPANGRPSAAAAKRRRPAAAVKHSPQASRAGSNGRPQMTIYRSGGVPAVAGRAGAAGVAAAGRAGVAGAAAAGRVGVAVRELPDSGVVVRLTRGRLWIGLLGGMLAGIVALNVISLGLTSGSGQTGVQIDQLQRDNSALRADIAEKLSATRVQSAAPTLGLSVPPAVDITYLTSNPSDLSRAAKVLAGQATAAAAPWTPSAPPDSFVTPAADATQPVPSTDTTTSSPSTSAPTSTPAPTSSNSAPVAPGAPSSTSGGSSGGVGTGL